MKTYFNGTFVLGLNNNSKNHDAVAVWRDGAVLNQTGVKPHHWPNWDNNVFHNADVIRHTCIGNYELMSKSQLKDQLGIKNVKSSQNGHKLFKDTKLGDVIYCTYDTNKENFSEALKVGFVDKKCKIHI